VKYIQSSKPKQKQKLSANTDSDYSSGEEDQQSSRTQAEEEEERLQRLQRSGVANGWLFIGLNVADEVAVCYNRGGKDEHLHHTACAVAASINMMILNNTTCRVLRGAMLDAFHVLLADEVVTPGFNAWAFLKEFNRNRGVNPCPSQRPSLCVLLPCCPDILDPCSAGFGGFLVLASLLPLLRFRVQNAVGLLRRLTGKQNEKLSETWGGRIFKWATCALCLALLALDATWTKWVLRNMITLVQDSFLNKKRVTVGRA